MAQENVAQIAVPEEVQEAIEEVAEKSLKEEQKPEEIKIDTEIKPEDLSVGKARILPGSPFYGFKNLFRGVREGLTRNPLVKAELRLKHADERIIEAQQLIEEKGGGKAEGG